MTENAASPITRRVRSHTAGGRGPWIVCPKVLQNHVLSYPIAMTSRITSIGDPAMTLVV